HNVVDSDTPDIFKDLIDFDDMYALEVELRGEPRNIYFTNEHLLQFIAYLQTEEEFEEEILEKKKIKERSHKISNLSNTIYSTHSWLKREETIPLELAQGFIRNATYWDHPKAGYYVSADHSHRIKNDYLHGWSVKFGANYFLVGKAIERCKKSINEYIEKIQNKNHAEINILRDKLKIQISGAVATSNNYEYDGYYPIENGYMKFGTQAINVVDGANFLIRELMLDEFLEKS
ncbi:hypothetical protein, partial [Sulfurovum riftiae]|uniref:hypothetical protein n=1 Tax=Sulfurovum riftiae TaxID=1630136 RepID=UPI000A8921AD